MQKRDSIIRTVGLGVATAVLTGVVMAALGLDSGGGDTIVMSASASDTGRYESTGGFSPAPAPIQTASSCQTPFLACPMYEALPQGTPCMCSNAFGAVPGVAR